MGWATTRSNQQQPRATPGAARNNKEQPRNSQELGKHQEQPGAARSNQEPPGAARSSQEQPGAVRIGQAQPEGARSLKKPETLNLKLKENQRKTISLVRKTMD